MINDKILALFEGNKSKAEAMLHKLSPEMQMRLASNQMVRNPQILNRGQMIGNDNLFRKYNVAVHDLDTSSDPVVSVVKAAGMTGPFAVPNRGVKFIGQVEKDNPAFAKFSQQAGGLKVKEVEPYLAKDVIYLPKDQSNALPQSMVDQIKRETGVTGFSPKTIYPAIERHEMDELRVANDKNVIPFGIPIKNGIFPVGQHMGPEVLAREKNLVQKMAPYDQSYDAWNKIRTQDGEYSDKVLNTPRSDLNDMINNLLQNPSMQTFSKFGIDAPTPYKKPSYVPSMYNPSLSQFMDPNFTYDNYDIHNNAKVSDQIAAQDARQMEYMKKYYPNVKNYSPLQRQFTTSVTMPDWVNKAISSTSKRMQQRASAAGRGWSTIQPQFNGPSNG